MDKKPYPPNIRNLEIEFNQRLSATSEQVSAYENEVLQALARSLIPSEKMEKAALQECGETTVTPKVRDQLLLHLLKWFKYEFFTWTDQPKCHKCQDKTVYDAHMTPTPEELRHGANRVEGYTCRPCGTSIRFPRYNDPEKLLETRTGRCGEWANCFTLCARALGYEARFVLDWTDHVWTEVFSEQQRRWLHCDPCENACDTPFMYEEGWGKKLSYVIGFAHDHIVDVTWRYSRKHRDVIQRRLSCREAVLLKFLERLNSLKPLPENRRKLLNERFIGELVEFLWSRKALKPGETEGRTSGDLNWRKQRGELGEDTLHAQTRRFVFEPTAEEIDKRTLIVEYRISNDQYSRPIANTTSTGWRSCVYESENILRKEELDWKMVYLARSENTQAAKVDWKFDFNSSNLQVGSISIYCSSQTFENGSVNVMLCTDDTCHKINVNKENNVENLDGCEKFELKAMLTGGKGNRAWQHAQLFRAPVDNKAPSLVVKVTLKGKETRV